MSTIYVYANEDNTHVATITGDSCAAVEKVAAERFGINDYSWTYSPAFGAISGLTENPDAEEIDA